MNTKTMATKTPSLMFYIICAIAALLTLPLFYVAGQHDASPLMAIFIVLAFFITPLTVVLIRSSPARNSFALALLLTIILPASLVALTGGIENTPYILVAGATIVLGYIFAFALAAILSWPRLRSTALSAILWSAIFGLIGIELVIVMVASFSLDSLQF